MSRYPTTEMCNGALLEAFEPTARDSDIFCSTTAKSGQTWLMTLLYHLRSRGLDPEMGGRGTFDSMPWLEIPFDVVGNMRRYDQDARLAEFAALKDPRIFKMHVLYDEIPRPVGSRSRVITITRDLRELPYSMYSHLVGMKQIDPDKVDFNAYFERWLEFGYGFQLARSFWPHRNEPHLLWLRYEDLQADLRAQARRICVFLGWDVSEADLDRVLPLVSFAAMQQSESRLFSGSSGGIQWREGSRFFREGGVGKNRARLSEEQQARVVARAREVLEPECFDHVMSLK